MIYKVKSLYKHKTIVNKKFNNVISYNKYKLKNVNIVKSK